MKNKSSSNTKFELIDSTTNGLRSINVVTSIIMIFTLLTRYRLSYIERYIQLDLFLKSSFMDNSDYLWYIVEVLINCFFMPPAASAQFKTIMLGGEYTFRLDSLVAVFSVVRIYHFVRLYVHYSVWFTGETQLICKKFGFIPDLYFVIKTELKVRPFKVLLSAMLVVALVAEIGRAHV